MRAVYSGRATYELPNTRLQLHPSHSHPSYISPHFRSHISSFINRILHILPHTWHSASSPLSAFSASEECNQPWRGALIPLPLHKLILPGTQPMSASLVRILNLQHRRRRRILRRQPVTTFAGLFGVLPQPILLVFRHPALDEDIVRILR